MAVSALRGPAAVVRRRHAVRRLPPVLIPKPRPWRVLQGVAREPAGVADHKGTETIKLKLLYSTLSCQDSGRTPVARARKTHRWVELVRAAEPEVGPPGLAVVADLGRDDAPLVAGRAGRVVAVAEAGGRLHVDLHVHEGRLALLVAVEDDVQVVLVCQHSPPHHRSLAARKPARRKRCVLGGATPVSADCSQVMPRSVEVHVAGPR